MIGLTQIMEFKMMRAQFIYEKFTEESDPIKDLGIGRDYLRKLWREERKNIGSTPAHITYDRYFGKSNKDVDYKFDVIWNIWLTFENLCITENDNNAFKLTYDQRSTNRLHKSEYENIYTEVINFLNKNFYTNIDINMASGNFLNEKFEQDSDPIKDLRIGLRFASLKPGDIISPKKIAYMIDIGDSNKFLLNFKDKAHRFRIDHNFHSVVISVKFKSDKLYIEAIPMGNIHTCNSTYQQITRGDFKNWKDVFHWYYKTASIEAWTKYFEVVE